MEGKIYGSSITNGNAFVTKSDLAMTTKPLNYPTIQRLNNTTFTNCKQVV
ncbi:MAG: hypothetical protein ACUVQT_02360 [bacterium]